MTTSVWLKSTALWLLILVLAVANGLLREHVLIPALGSFAGLAASGALLSATILLVAYLAAPWYGPLSTRRWLGIGLYWLALTLAFEFGLGRYVQHHTWDELLAAYTFQGGNLWPLVLLATVLSPWIAARMRGRAE